MARTYRRNDYTGGQLGVATQTPRPSQILDEQGVPLPQHGGERMPAECPKCGSLWLEAGYWEARCLCGFIWYRTVGTMSVPKHPPHRRPEWS